MVLLEELILEKYNYNNKECWEIFKDILDGKIKRFPTGYWKQPGIEIECVIITRYFIEKVLKWQDSDIREKTCEMIFRKYHLSGMLEYVFNRSPFLAIENAYPGKYKVWELTCTPKGFWKNEKNRNDALSFLLDKTGKIKIDELTNKDFLNNGLGGLMDYLTTNKIYKNMDRKIIESGKSRNDIELTVSFSVTNKNANRNKINARLELPVEMLKEIGIDKENNKVSLHLDIDKHTITIKKI